MSVNPPFHPSKSSRHRQVPKDRGSPVYSPEHLNNEQNPILQNPILQNPITTGNLNSVKMTDILPLLLCAGILVLLYFMLKEYNIERKNTETYITSIMNRLDTLEQNKFKNTDPPPILKKTTPAAPPDVVATNTPDKDGIYELKNSIVSFNPSSAKNDNPAPDDEISDRADQSSDSEVDADADEELSGGEEDEDDGTFN